jgi:Tol biopolymer transport system component
VGRALRFRLLASAVVLLAVAHDVRGQYFGRNKVQYDRDHVLVLATDHFDIYYAREDGAAALLAGRMAERWHARLSKVFDHTLRGRQPVVLYGSHRRFEQTNVYSGVIDESTGGFTDSRKRRIVLPFAASLSETDHVLGHEIVHAFQFDIADTHRVALTVPLWFIEGMAEYLTLGADDPQTAMWMRDAVASGQLPSIQQLGSGRYFPYRWGAAVWSHLVAEFGEDLPAKAMRTKRDVKRRLEQVTGRTLAELTEGWHASLRSSYATASSADESSGPLISRRNGGGRLNLAASLSPDGQRIVFLSERDQFSIDLFLADAHTGQVIRKLLTTATSSEFESLQYLHSAGAWDPSGSQFALATVARGRAMLLVLGVDDRSTTREIVLDTVDEAYSPTWSPDGRLIAFAGMKGGATDLWTVDLPTGGLRRLTHDLFADLHPGWSPDGRTIAFATDRFTSSLARLAFGEYRIGLLDVESAQIAPAPFAPGMNHLNPVWSGGPGGGRDLYFIGDRGGVGNVFRMDIPSSTIFQVTDVATAVSGVTRVSPVLSISAHTGALAFSVFRNSGFVVQQIPDVDRIEGMRVAAAAGATAAADVPAIPPVPPLPTVAANRPQKQYEPRLALEGIGSPYFSAGGGPLGNYVSGGASMLFGDLLGDHQLLTAVYVSSHLDESALGALYVNRRARLNWGVTFEQTPELRVRYTGSQLDPERDNVLTRTRERMLWTNRHLGGFAAYPLNRSQRLEFSAGFRQIGFERDRRIDQISTRSGMVIDQETEPLPSEPSVGLADAGIALIGDTAIFGATAPIVGSRYRFQVTGNVGGLTYTNVLADYRRYLMPVRPYTLAVRILHSGRYGEDAGDFRLRDAYVGSSTLVRGYGPSAVVRSECPTGSSNCPALNSLLANKVVAAKIELRVPVWSTLMTTSQVRYGPLPVDAFVFADAGAGWGGEQRFGPGGSDGKVVRSLGAGVRGNIAGLVLEMAAARPLDLKRSGWSFSVNLRPGF